MSGAILAFARVAVPLVLIALAVRSGVEPCATQTRSWDHSRVSRPSDSADKDKARSRICSAEAALEVDAQRTWAEGARLAVDDAIALAFGTKATATGFTRRLEHT